MKFRKKPVVIEATQWFKNGDHPDDDIHLIPDKSFSGLVSEGKIVRYFRHPDISGDQICSKCGIKMHYHGWIDTLEDGHNVCPGDWIITGVKGERYPCKPDIFVATYDAVAETSISRGSGGLVMEHKIVVDTDITSDGRIFQEVSEIFNDVMTSIMRTVIDTKEQQAIDALIRLGWTPPVQLQKVADVEGW